MMSPRRWRWPTACWSSRTAASPTMSMSTSPRPRRRGSAELAALEGSILQRTCCEGTDETLPTCEATMNTAVRDITHRSAMRHVSRFPRRHAPSDRRRQRHHGRAGQGHFRHDGDLGRLAVGRSADADRQHQPRALVLAADPPLRRLRRQHPRRRSARYRRAFCRQGRAEGRRSLCGRRWITRASGVPLLVGALAAIDCEVEEIVERHSHAHRHRPRQDLQISTRTAALAYWHGQYVAIDRDEDAAKLAEVSLPSRGLHARR